MSFSSSRNDKGAPDDLTKDEERHPADDAAMNAVMNLTLVSWGLVWPGLSYAAYGLLTKNSIVASRLGRALFSMALAYPAPYYMMEYGST